MQEKKKNDVMSVINSYAGSHRHLIKLGRCLGAISAFVAMVPFMYIWLIIKTALEGKDLDGIRSLGWQAVLITICGMLIYIGALMCTHKAAFRVQANMRKCLMKKIMALPLGVFDKEGTGKIRRIVNDTTAATETYIAHNLVDKAVANVTPIGLLILLLFFNWKFGLICMIPAVIGFSFMSVMMGSGMKKKMEEYQDALGVMSSEAVEYVRGVPVVKTFGQTINSFTRFKTAIEKYAKWAIDYTVSLRIPMTGFMTGINAIFAFIVFSAFVFSKGGITPDLVLDVMYYIIITPLITVTLSKVAYAGEQEMMIVDSINRIHAILDVEELKQAKDEVALKDYSITLEDISYHYEGAEQNAVDHLSVEIPSGSHVAFVGPSGGGKTTTAELIARFFDVSEGAVKIGGVNVKEIPFSQLMNTVSFVFQDSRLLKTSIFENVRLARPDATREEVMEALKKAQCMDIIEKIPQGMDTVIGAKGTYLSGGEQQRISIARAILKDAPVLILDEATAFADPDNEAKVQKAFEEMAKEKTLIMVAHRLSTVTNTDRIFVLKDGTCVESGKHEELLKKGGLYHDMYEEYTKSVEWKVGA